VHWGCHNATTLDIEVDPERRCFGGCQADLALQGLKERRVLETERVRFFFCSCVCLLLQYLLQSCSRGGRGIVEDMCYERRRAEAHLFGLIRSRDMIFSLGKNSSLSCEILTSQLQEAPCRRNRYAAVDLRLWRSAALSLYAKTRVRYAPVPVPDFLCVGIRDSTSAKAVSAKKPPFA